MDINKTGAFIAELRHNKDLTQKQLADLLLVSDKAVSRWETGRGMPDIENLEAIARVLDVSVAELLRGERISEPVAPAEASELATDGMDLMRQVMRKRAVMNTLTGLLAGIVLVVLIVVHLTSPIAIPYQDDMVLVEQFSDGTLIATSYANVEGWSVQDEDGTVFVSCHTSWLHQLLGQPSASVARIGDSELVSAVLYYPGDGGDALLYGTLPGGGVETMPRLIYNMWLVIGVVASIIGFAAYALLRRRWYARRVLLVALVPACFTLSLVIVLWGKFDQIYNASFYFSGICLLGIVLYALCFLLLSRRKAHTKQAPQADENS